MGMTENDSNINIQPDDNSRWQYEGRFIQNFIDFVKETEEKRQLADQAAQKGINLSLMFPLYDRVTYLPKTNQLFVEYHGGVSMETLESEEARALEKALPKAKQDSEAEKKVVDVVEKAINSHGSITSMSETEQLSKSMYKVLFGKDVPEGKEFANENDLYSEVAKELAKPGYSYEKDTLPNTYGLLGQQTAEDYIACAYYHSDAFAMRAARSLGYESTEGMTAEDKELYDKIIARGRDVKFLERDDSFFEDSRYSGNEDIYSIHEKTLDGKIGLSVVGHEMGHHLYVDDANLNDGTIILNPGAKQDSLFAKTFNYEDPEKYGKENSPLNTVNSDAVDVEKGTDYYKSIISSVSWKGIPKEEKEALKEYYGKSDIKTIMSLLNIEHDNMGFERGADVHGVRMTMFREGIWNPFDGTDVTEKQIEQYRQNHPESRIFNYWDKEKAAYYLNNIAQYEQKGQQVDVSTDSKVMMTASIGGKAVNLEMSQSDHMKMMALDDSHKLTMLSSMLPDARIGEMSEGQKKELITSVNESIYDAPKPSVFMTAMTDKSIEEKPAQQVAKAPDINPTLLAQANFSQEMAHVEKQNITQERSSGLSV